MNRPAADPIIVIGAGICGVSTAIWLQRSGHRVLLLDKGQPGRGASHGNSGLLAPWSVDPVSSPALWREAPGYLINPNSPLFLKWASLPTVLPWIWKFMSHATDAGTRRIVDHLSTLLYDSVDQHKALVRDTPVQKWLHDSKFNFVYPNRKAFEVDAYSWQMKSRANLVPTVLTGAAVREAEPMLSDAFDCLAVLEGQGHITDPGQYVAGLVDHFCDQGGQFIQAEVQALQQRQGRVYQVETDNDTFSCSAAVITSGIWSKTLMQKLGLAIPMIAERGYHVIYENPSQLPRNPMLITTGKFGVNAMDTGLRCAGIVELGDHHASPSRGPIKLLRRQSRAAFPALKYSGTVEWMGFRPSTPDSKPLIGELGNSRIFTGFGHQHIGITAGPKTGRLLSQLIDGQSVNIDLALFSTDRFRR